MAQFYGGPGLTLAVLGCGTMGIAILSGIMASLEDHQGRQGLLPPNVVSLSTSGTSTPMEELPERLPSRFVATVRRPASAKKIKSSLGQYSSPLTVLINENLQAAKEADVILLACKPQMFRDVLGGEEMKEALAGKLLISILAGVTKEQIEGFLFPGFSRPSNACLIVRAMPNTASFVRESMTVVATSDPPLPSHQATLITWIFNRIGRVVHLAPSMMDASTALCGSGPAFMALVLEAMADGGVAMGLPRAEAQIMAAQTMRGTTGLVLNGEHPAVLRDKVSTPGGCTIGGLLVLEEGTVRGTMARAVREATVVASQLGKGVQGVNGTRF
ncbi:pyrroline-5-carboxylate reductase [Patellaria atrata CBS 101060]|uniref:Pyrroline-5-carboxylate reductase n=1 Tax=Patellaria atrata CBS 101060 TaxID=1346257 RepID=A0A9P4S7I5_9PEZI|nr:pyrroline-5-carboxylate reductase [Patellaria atrata CBS 101060]